MSHLLTRYLPWKHQLSTVHSKLSKYQDFTKYVVVRSMHIPIRSAFPLPTIIQAECPAYRTACAVCAVHSSQKVICRQQRLTSQLDKRSACVCRQKKTRAGLDSLQPESRLQTAPRDVPNDGAVSETASVWSGEAGEIWSASQYGVYRQLNNCLSAAPSVLEFLLQDKDSLLFAFRFIVLSFSSCDVQKKSSFLSAGGRFRFL